MNRFTEKELLALKAVFFGCNTNRKIVKGENETYCIFDENMKEVAEISFLEALEIVYKIINSEEKND